MMSFVRVVAANWCSRTHVKVPQPKNSYAFSGAKTAATFILLNADLLKVRDPLAAPEAAAGRTELVAYAGTQRAHKGNFAEFLLI
jgi:hypothetical protein